MIDEADMPKAKRKTPAKPVIKIAGLATIVLVLVAVALMGNTRKQAPPPDDDIAKIMAAASKPLPAAQAPPPVGADALATGTTDLGQVGAAHAGVPSTAPMLASESNSGAASDTMPVAAPSEQATQETQALAVAPSNVLPAEETAVQPPATVPPAETYTLRAVLKDGAVIEDGAGTPHVVRIGDSL